LAGRLEILNFWPLARKLAFRAPFASAIRLWHLRENDITRNEWPTGLNQSWIYPKWIKRTLQNHCNECQKLATQIPNTNHIACAAIVEQQHVLYQ
jgi:hypothetical protein